MEDLRVHIQRPCCRRAAWDLWNLWGSLPCIRPELALCCTLTSALHGKTYTQTQTRWKSSKPHQKQAIIHQVLECRKDFWWVHEGMAGIMLSSCWGCCVRWSWPGIWGASQWHLQSLGKPGCASSNPLGRACPLQSFRHLPCTS